MVLKMISLLLGWILLAVPSLFASVEPPPGILDLHETSDIFRTQFRRKLQEMSESFIVRASPQAIVYQASKETICAQSAFSAGQSLVRINLQRKSTPTTWTDLISYEDCSQKRLLVEEMTVTNQDPAPELDVREILRGERDFSLPANASGYFYRMSNLEGTTILSITVNRTQNGWRASYAIMSQPVVNYTFQEKKTGTNLERTWMWHFPEVFLTTSNFRYRFPISPIAQVKNIYDTNGEMLQQTQYIVDAAITSQQALQTYLQEKLSFADDKKFDYGRLSLARTFVGYHLQAFPSTSFVGSVGQNQRLLNELRLANIRLLGNSEINLVQQLMQSLILAIEKGLLNVDDRR
jgi:hypothetical protein